MEKDSLDARSELKGRDKWTKVSIRPANPSDAPAVSRLMYCSSPKLALYLFGESERSVVKIFKSLFELPEHMFSYTQAFVAEFDGRSVGSIFCFEGKMRKTLELAVVRKVGLRWFRIVRVRRIPLMVRAIADVEKVTLPVLREDYHVYMLAVLPNMRRQGIGRELMGFAEAQARSKQLKRVTLDVEIDNFSARRFYEHLGYQICGILVNPRFFSKSGIRGSVRMVKPIV